MSLRVKQLTSGCLYEIRITQTTLSADIHTPDRDVGPLEGTAAGSWKAGVVEQSQGEVLY